MNVIEAIESRVSCRQFTDQPVPAETIRAILYIARRAPSGGNLQPWRVHILGGKMLQEFRSFIGHRLLANPEGEEPEYAIYPPNLWEPYRSRRFKCGEDLYATIGVTRENKLGRLAQLKRNYDFFSAPLALFFSIDRDLGPDQWADLGMFRQNIMLLAREHGLHTCAQESWSLWHKSVREFLLLEPKLMLFCGM